MRGCSTSRLQHSFRPPNVCQMFWACRATLEEPHSAWWLRQVAQEEVAGSRLCTVERVARWEEKKNPETSGGAAADSFLSVWLCLAFSLGLRLGCRPSQGCCFPASVSLVAVVDLSPPQWHSHKTESRQKERVLLPAPSACWMCQKWAIFFSSTPLHVFFSVFSSTKDLGLGLAV